MAVPSSHDDGFREIQLSGKQLVFLFMAVTVVLVVTFLTGVLVGRGVRVERTESAQAGALIDAPATPDRVPSASNDAAAGDPRSAAPPTPAEDDATPDAKSAKAIESLEEPQVAVKRSAPRDAPAVPQLKPVTPVAKPAAAPVVASAAKSAGTPPAVPPPAIAVPPVAGATADSSERTGFAVQVAAVNVRGEADAIVRRLTGKGYAAYMEVPKGNAAVFRVRVGTFKTRREAQAVADKLKKEEKFKPWVTR